MEKRQQRFSIGYFILAVAIILGLQTYFAAPTVETISYSEFKSLAKKGQVSNLVIGEKTIRGEIKPEAVKQAVPAERLKSLDEEIRKLAKLLLEKEVVDRAQLQVILRAHAHDGAADGENSRGGAHLRDGTA